MVDIETLSTEPNASVFQIAAKVFDPMLIVNMEEFNEEIFRTTVQEEIDATTSFECASLPFTDARHVSKDTLEFWLKKNGETFVGIIAKSEQLKAKDMWLAFAEWMQSVHESYGERLNVHVWGNGPSFDNVILRDGLKELDESYARLIPYYNDKCVRTLNYLAADMVGLNVWEYRNKVSKYTKRTIVKHDAMSDVIEQINAVQIAHAVIYKKELLSNVFQSTK